MRTFSSILVVLSSFFTLNLSAQSNCIEKQKLASKIVTYCIINPESCKTTEIDLSHSSWLKDANTYYSPKGNVSTISINGSRRYSFKPIPTSILKSWENSFSPGNFYHENIKPKFKFDNCDSYYDDW